jgi:hypothetical protein
VWATEKVPSSPCSVRILFSCFIAWVVEGVSVTWQANGYHRCTKRPTVRQAHTLSCETAWSTKDISLIRFILILSFQLHLCLPSELFSSELLFIQLLQIGPYGLFQLLLKLWIRLDTW